MLNVQRLRLLDQLSVLGTISAVAEAAGYTRPAVSQQLAQLERELGMVLLEKAGRSVRLTGSAKAILEHSRPLFESLESVESFVATVSGGIAGEVRLAAFSSVTNTLIPHAIQSLSNKYPGLLTRIFEQEPSEAFLDLVANRLDIAIVDDPYPNGYSHKLIQSIPYLTDYYFAVVPESHPLGLRNRIRLADLASERWAISRNASNHNALIIRSCRALGYEPLIVCECSHASTVVEMVRNGIAISVLPGLNLNSIPPGVVVRPLANPLAREISITFRKGRESHPAIRAVVEALRTSATLNKTAFKLGKSYGGV
jgi:DNA-binding transcriptional LysR family regulator